MTPRPPRSTLFPYTTLFRSQTLFFSATMPGAIAELAQQMLRDPSKVAVTPTATTVESVEQRRSEEHTSELQSQFHLVCRLLLEKKKKKKPSIKTAVLGAYSI